MKINFRLLFLVLLIAAVFFAFGCKTTPLSEGGSPEGTPENPVTPIEGGDIERPEPPEEDTFLKVEESLLEGDTDAALETLDAYIEKEPEDLQTLVLKAALLMSDGEVVEARALLDRVLSEEPENIDALFQLSILEGWEGNRETQLALLEKISELDPENGDVLASIGDFHFLDKDYDEAEKAYMKALELEPANISALTGYGNLLMQKGDYDEAEERYDSIVEIYPSDPFVYGDRSRARIAQENYVGAEEDLSEAVDLSPNYYWNYVDRGKLRLNNLYNANTAIEDFNKAIALEPDYFYAYIFRAGILDDTGEIDKAISDYKKLIELKPDYYFAFRSLGILQYLKGEWEEARQNLMESFSYEEDPGVLLLTAFTYFREDRDKEGKDFIKNILDSFPRDDHFYNIGRMAIDPGYEVFALKGIEEEQDMFVKTRMKFYVGALLQAMGGDSLAYTYYDDVRELNLLGMYERRIALKELEVLDD
ncbi:MAG: tetratricopeptide repeat protein [Spirochaetales bacterium]|nr:tetratricopeptide repeat protein [Spirochaetales bacterium]